MKWFRKRVPKFQGYLAVQPARCKGCLWGSWEGSAQFCSKPHHCVKEDKDHADCAEPG